MSSFFYYYFSFNALFPMIFKNFKNKKYSFCVFMNFSSWSFSKKKKYISIHQKKKYNYYMTECEKNKIYSSFVNKISSKKPHTFTHFQMQFWRFPSFINHLMFVNIHFFLVIWWFTIIILNKDYIFIKKKRLTVKIY